MEKWAKLLKLLLLGFDATLILYKMSVGKTFTLEEFATYVALNYFLIQVIHKLDTV